MHCRLSWRLLPPVSPVVSLHVGTCALLAVQTLLSPCFPSYGYALLAFGCLSPLLSPYALSPIVFLFVFIDMVMHCLLSSSFVSHVVSLFPSCGYSLPAFQNRSLPGMLAGHRRFRANDCSNYLNKNKESNVHLANPPPKATRRGLLQPSRPVGGRCTGGPSSCLQSTGPEILIASSNKSDD